MMGRTLLEEELAQMRARIDELAGKDALSPEELKEFVYLIWDVAEDGVSAGYYAGGELSLPNRGQRTILIKPGEPEENWADVVLLDGLDDDLGSGELVCLDTVGGRLQWRMGIFWSYYSQFLDRTVLLDTINIDEPVLSRTPLSPEECSRVAKTVYKAHKQS